MQTSFTLAQLADPDVAESEKILRACVHCGFCTATCPTYVLDGNELDSPRGRIYLIKDMLENDRPATAEVTLHIDRCLSCLACMTTCPSGVHYMHLVDHARAHIEKTYRRPAHERLLRTALAKLLPYPQRFRLVLAAALAGKPFARLAEAVGTQAACSHAAARPGAPSAQRHCAANLPGGGSKKGPCGFARRLRQRPAGAADQCRGDSGIDAARHRSRGRGRLRLLRLARPSHGPGRRRRSAKRVPISMPGLRSGRWTQWW